ncbi:hypothetical protein LAZ67_19002721, partial [Cordylochernes scorpioides]
MASYQFKEYNEETETFETFYERLEQFLILEEAGDEKKKAYLLTLMGSKTYGVLKNLCSPILPKDKTFDNLIDILKRHFSPKRSIVVERFIFFKRMQLKEESISDYLVEIKRLASSCIFGNFLEDSLRDKMVCGLYNAKIQNRILSEGDISLAKVIEIALSMEAAEKNTKLFHLEQGEDCVDKLRMERKVESNFQNGKCKHCGKQHKELCRFKEAICFKCNKKGHIASICWSSRRNLRQHQNQPGNIHQIGDQEEEEEYVQKIISVTIPEYKINFASSDPPYLMELKVEGNFIKFEMDTGSGLTLISEKDFKNSLQHLKLEKASIIVRTYDGTVVPILGKINVKVECQDITYKLRALVVKGEKRALMGREWINRLKLGCFAVKHMPVEITIEEILKENQALFVETTEPIKGFTFSVNMCDVNPIFHKARPVPFAIRPAVTEALDKMVAKGYLCEVASSKWATPVVVVPKKNKEIRICCDFKVTLNKYLDTAAYPLPTQQDLFSTLAKGKYFSKLDLRNAYLQLEVDPGTRPLLTINTHKGLFRFKRMPFGLANAPSYFQSVMDRVLSGIRGVICYIDDVLIATASIEEHLALLKTIFARLAKYNIKLKKEKCLFLQKEIEYLGHLVTEEGIRPLDHKVQAIQKAKTPTNISELRSFLGLVNFYGKFIPNLPELLKPLHELLHKKRPWVWTKECGEAIDKCKNSITSERVLVPYDATLPLCLATDASQIGVGAVLSHIIEGQERPIMFASRTLSVAEQNYSQIEKEALAIIYGVTKFHQFIYGRKFILITDHKPLVTILGSRSGIPTLSTSRLQRWALILSAYTYDIKFRRTQDHGNADLLSRFPVGCEEIPRLNNVYALSYVEELPITAEEIATETEKDEVLSLAKFYTQQGWPEKVADHLRPYFQRKLELTVDGECLVWGMRVVIPPSLRIKMLNCLHETHSGMNKMKAVARSHFWWPNLDTQIEFLVNKCRSCQQSQDGPNKGKWQPWRWSTRPWQRIHIDFANKENINLLIVVDSHSKWIEAIPMRETTTRKTIEQLRRLFSSYGLPEELVSDNGPQFTGSEMKGFLEGNGIKQTLIPAYHPQSNGLAERAVRTIKTALDKNKRKIGDTIQDTLSKVLLAYRSTPHVTTGKTPSELFIGRALRTRVSLIHPSLASRVRDQQARQMKYDRRTHLEEFQIDDLVWCKNFRGGDKWIPGKIVGKKGTRVYTILIHGQVKAYHRDQIRKRWRNGEEDESGDGERQPEHSRGAGPSAIISEVVRDRGYMESLSPGLTSQRSDQDSEVQSDTDDGKSLEPLRSLDPEALKEEGPVLRRNPPRARRPPVEAQFKIGGIIQEDTKFNYFISQLEPKYIENIWDIINSKSDNKYSECKSRLLELFRESEGLRIKKLISGIELGDMKPSQLLQKLRSLATPDISDNLIKTLWLDKLPTSIKNILIVSEEDISKLAIMADKINEINSSKEIYDAEVPSSSTDRLIAKLEDLERQVSELRLDRSRSRSKNRPQSRPRSNSQRSFDPKGKYCYYHFRFGPNCLQNKCRSPCSLERVGKLQPADRVATSSSAGIQDCRNLRLFVTDKNTGLRFLVDSGADISIIPPKDKNRMPSSDYKLYAANGTEIVTYGTKVRNLDIGLRRQFQWPFVIANTNRAIIGADFLNNFGLIIDIKNKRLIDGITNLSIRGVIQSISDMGNISTLNSSSKVSAILTKYPNLCRPPSDFVEAKHSVKHYIPTRGQPIHSKARRLDSQRLTLAKAEFQYMLNNGIIRPSNSPWASPLHLVSKKDESLRPCGDYRRLNAVTLPDRYPIPRLDDFHHILKGTRVYSKIDLCKAFYQIPIAEEDKLKTAIITPFGLFEFNVMSFGLRNATATFQRFMHEVLRNLDFAFVYLDDILVASKTDEEHYSHLETLFSRLNSYGLRINLSKSKFLVQEIDFLGYLITSHGVKPLPTKVKAILEYKKPKTVHELRIFLGMLNFYRAFLNNAAETQAILHEYLRGAKKKDRSEIKWTEEAEVQFEKCKQALANTALLAYPDTELPISLCTDASDRAVGSVLQQLDNNNWKPIAFFSKKLNPAQCNYSTYDRELLTIYLSIKFFKHLLEAREFTILTDHKPLIYAFKQKNEKASPKQLRHLQYISQFTTDIKYIKGTDNIVADALSRVDAITTIDYEEIAKEQTGDSELQNLISKNTSLKFKQCPLQSGNLLWCDVSTNNIRPFIPIKFRMMVFRNFHELSHPGIKATTKQLTSRFIWPNMNKDIRKWAQACVNCQKCKVSIHTKSEIGKYQEVDERFSVVHIDLIGPLPPSNGNIYCLTCIDRYTSWMEVVPLPDMKSETVARAFYENWIVRFGAPHTVISDRGKQFTSQLFKDLTTLCGIKLRHSTAYHPQCNGKIERLHRTIKTAIRAHNSIKWTETLPTVLLGLRAVLSTKIPTILCLRWTDRVKKPLEPPYEGPFPVLERTDKYFTLKVKGKNVTTSIDRLRPAYLLADSDNITAEHPTATRPIVSGALPSTSSQQNPDPPDVEKYTEFQGTGSAPDLPRTRSGRIIKKP